MNYKTCEKGHYYDGSSATCPFCEAEAAGQLPRTMGVDNWVTPGDFPDTGMFAPEIDDIPCTRPTAPPEPDVGFSCIGFTDSGSNFGFRPEAIPHTEPVRINGSTDCDPIVGWLVCVNGPNRGKDYRLHSGTNFIGSSKSMDVCIENDSTVSSNRHASISYDDRTKTFFIEKGEVRNLIYVNNVAVRKDADLNIYDKIEIGNTMLVFIPLCGESFNWQEY